MESNTLGLLHRAGAGGASSGSSTNESTVEDAELELGLGLSLGGGSTQVTCKGSSAVAGGGGGRAWGECGRILTAKDFPLVGQSQSQWANNNNNKATGTKRPADSTSQVVGWPPIRSHRVNSLVNLAKAPRSEQEKSIIAQKENSSTDTKKKISNGHSSNNVTSNGKSNHLGFVKVNMDGISIGRKVDLNAHSCYNTFAQALEDMFFRSPDTEKDQSKTPPKLLDGSSEFVLTYEDKEGDWMLVGDVPWGMFISSVKRLRIMRTTEAKGLVSKELVHFRKLKKERKVGELKHLAEVGYVLTCSSSLSRVTLVLLDVLYFWFSAVGDIHFSFSVPII
ncbi:hypothetical protein ACFE04_012904 [Oxalis oulophora]